jgi:hypothetical protein
MTRYIIIILLILLIIYGLYQFKNDNFLADNQGVVNVSYIKPSKPTSEFQVNKQVSYTCDDAGKCTLELFANPPKVSSVKVSSVSTLTQRPTSAPTQRFTPTPAPTKLLNSLYIMPKITDIQDRLTNIDNQLDVIQKNLTDIQGNYSNLQNTYISNNITKANNILQTLQSSNSFNYTIADNASIDKFANVEISKNKLNDKSYTEFIVLS